MITRFGAPELLIVLGIIILLFGVGRISKIAGELGSGIRAFKEGIGSKTDKEETPAETPEKDA